MKVLALVPLLLACGKTSKSGGEALAPAQIQQVRDGVSAAQAKAEKYASAREAGLRKAWRGLEPSSSPCPVPMPKLALYRDYAERTPEENKARDVADRHMTVVPAGAVLGDPPPPDEKMVQRIERESATKGPRRDQFDRQSKMLAQIATEGKVPGGFMDAAEVLALATEIGSDPYWDWELVVVTAEHRAPLFNPDGFIGGEIAGKAFVWSFKEGRVVCAADVHATSQPEMKLTIDPKNQKMQQHHELNEDLENQAYRAAIEGLRAVPPAS